MRTTIATSTPSTPSTSSPYAQRVYQTSVMRITPVEAALILDRYNPDNRTLRASMVSVYAEAMTLGHWRSQNGQSIVFDTSGDLMNGQHRLAAIVRAGIPVDIGITLGAQREAMTTIDTGLRRSLGDLMSLAGHSSAHRRAAAIRWLYYLEIGPVALKSRPSVAPTVLLDAVARWADATPFLACAGRGMRTLTPRRGLTAALMTITHRVDGVKARDFWGKVGEGLGITDRSDPAARLRALYIAHKGRQHSRMAPYYQVGVVAKAWRAHLAGRPIGSLRMTLTERFPTIEGASICDGWAS